MIDFRYHLVSIISVFLALAVGIVLGAGPLKQPIGESLQSQVDSLRSDRDDLRTKLDTANGSIDKLNTYITESAPALLTDTLKGTKVTLVSTPNTPSQTIKDVQGRLEDAGATVSDGGQLTPESLKPEESEKAIEALKEIDPKLPADPREAFEKAIAHAYAGEHEGAYNADQATKVIDELRSAKRLNGGSYARADVVVFLLGDSTEEDAQPVDDYTGLLTELGATAPTVASGTVDSGSQGAVKQLRDRKVPATTVDGVDLSAGTVITPLAVADLQSTKKHQSYGFADSAKALVPNPLPEPRKG
ncbi:copper transporter [uncultured Brevibacterium sp.]|uniref:copper transporter n=1 Tax=uncultured Brevibacterium sp. TaxID=189678 RepID=UPI0025F2017A|nr:copper transporter [uncultured Brevibacterium sp.]